MPKDVDKRVYNLQSKQIVKVFSKIFKLDHQEMLDDLSGGDVSETVAGFFEKARSFRPARSSTLTIIEVDEFLDELSNLTLSDQQVEHFKTICKKCTADDIKTIIRLVKHDLKMNCGARHVFDALHPDAYSSFQKSRDLKIILKEYVDKTSGAKSGKSSKSGLQLMTAVSPMLAEPCKDFDKAIKKCPEGFYSEIKYDGERVQIHKKGNEFKFFSRNLKPVQDHKIGQLKEFLPKAFPHGDDLIVDSEILMVNTKTGDPLPFGTLGKHKKEEQSDAMTCLFIFDCLYFNGDDLMKKSMKERRKFLEDNLTVIKNRVQLSETKILNTKNQLVEMTKTVLKKGLEGLVLKGMNTVYEPGKRRWLKVKKDYLLKGAIADTADLVVLGAWFGTGKMGGQYSIFLMGCYDKDNSIWKTVTKVHSGLNDLEMERMHRKISPLMAKTDSNTRLPSWISVSSGLIPNALAKDPNKMPVFEITGAEFTQSDVHTASSISIRFPRITKIRSDKSPKEATSLEELVHLFEESKAGVNLDELNQLKDASISQEILLTAATSKKPAKESDDSEEDVPMKTTKSVGDSPKKEEKQKILKRKSQDSDVDDEIPVKKTKAVEGETLFKEHLLFATKEIKEKYSDKISEFKKHGGKCADDSQSANLVLHEGKEIKSNAGELRQLYKPNCQHLQASWLIDSLKETKLKNPLHYFVKLHQI